MNEIKYKVWTGELDKCLHDCSVWLTSILSEYSDSCISDVVVSYRGSGWIVTVYYNL